MLPIAFNATFHRSFRLPRMSAHSLTLSLARSYENRADTNKTRCAMHGIVADTFKKLFFHWKFSLWIFVEHERSVWRWRRRREREKCCFVHIVQMISEISGLILNRIPTHQSHCSFTALLLSLNLNRFWKYFLLFSLSLLFVITLTHMTLNNAVLLLSLLNLCVQELLPSHVFTLRRISPRFHRNINKTKKKSFSSISVFFSSVYNIHTIITRNK